MDLLNDLPLIHFYPLLLFVFVVVDDYQSERAQILKAQGSNFRFTYGDYLCKALLGSIDPEFDQLDEVKCKCNIQ